MIEVDVGTPNMRDFAAYWIESNAIFFMQTTTHSFITSYMNSPASLGYGTTHT